MSAFGFNTGGIQGQFPAAPSGHRSDFGTAHPSGEPVDDGNFKVRLLYHSLSRLLPDSISSVRVRSVGMYPPVHPFGGRSHPPCTDCTSQASMQIFSCEIASEVTYLAKEIPCFFLTDILDRHCTRSTRRLECSSRQRSTCSVKHTNEDSYAYIYPCGTLYEPVIR